MEGSTARRYLLDLNDPDESVRNKAQYTLGDNSVRPEWVPDLIAGVTDGSPRVRFWAATALSRQHEAYAAAVPALIELLSDPDKWGNRQVAAGALATIGRPAAVDAVPALAGVLETDPEPYARVEAVRALGRLWPWNDHALSVLIGALDDPDERVRHYAVQQLNLMRARAGEAVPDLRRMAANGAETDALREDASRAVELILAGLPAIRYDRPYHPLAEVIDEGDFSDPGVPERVRKLIDREEYNRSFELIEETLEKRQTPKVWSEMWGAAQTLRPASAGRYYALYQETEGIRGAWHELERVVRSRTSVEKGLARLVDYHARIAPDPHWKLLKKLPVKEDLARLEAWITAAFSDEPPPDDAPGLWFGLLDVDRASGPTIDMHLDAGQLNDEGLHDLVFGGAWTPSNEFAHSEVLDEIYKTSFADEGGPLGDAAYTLLLAYGALAVRYLAKTLDPSLLLGGATQRVITLASTTPRTQAVGYHDGDSIGIGTLRPNGLTFPRP